jgi:hypothetical protein
LENWSLHFTFAANFFDVLTFIDSLGARSYQVKFRDHLFACHVVDDLDTSAVVCLTMEVRAWWKAHDRALVQPASASVQVQPCARVQLRLEQNRIDECIGHYTVHKVDPLAVIGAKASHATRSETAIRAFVAHQWARFISLWVKHSKQSNGATTAPRPRGGRPRDPNDDWAYEQVALGGRPRPEVYREWLVRIGERATQLTDPQDSFRRAITARRQERKKPEETE